MVSQHVQQPTHKTGHILDLVITRSGECRVQSLTVHDYEISDHHLITFDVAKQLNTTKRPQIAVRSLKRLDASAFASDVSQALVACTSTAPDLEDKVSAYNTVLTNALNHHAPLKTISIKGENTKPWYTDEIHMARQKRRQLERKYLKNGL